MRWSPGEVVEWRESWRGQTYFSVPVRVVEDTPRQLVYYLAEGTRFSFPRGAWPFGEVHPWAYRDAWSWSPDRSWPVPSFPTSGGE